MTNIEQFIQQFETLRSERWSVINDILDSTDDSDALLADVANLITMIYLSRQLAKASVGFQPFRKNNE